MTRPRRTMRCVAFAAVAALILLCIMAALGVAFAASSGTSLVQSTNLAAVQCSRLQSEGGLSYLTYVLGNLTLPSEVGSEDLLAEVGAALQARLNGTNNLSGATVMVGGSQISIPSVATDEGRFQASLTLDATSAVHLMVTGYDGAVHRTVGLSFGAAPGDSPVFDYGVASKGDVRLTGNAAILGANDAAEANVLSATYSTAESFKLTGNATMDGDAYSVNPDSHVTTTGNATIGGASGSGIAEHVHIGVDDVEFPEADPTVFEPYATNIVDGDTPTSGNQTFTNIRILANTNPTFSGNITLKGVVFVEAPNQVHFSGNVTFTGVIVTQDAGENVYEDNTIRFTGNTTIRGVEALPDEPPFAELRELPGTFLLAPGFGVTFTGNFGAVSGCMAADAFTWTGNATGTIHGPVINYGDSQFTLTGNARLTIDRGGSPDVPPGFSTPTRLTPIAGSYREY